MQRCLVFVRHAEANKNIREVFGQTSAPSSQLYDLTDDGTLELEAIANSLAGIDIAVANVVGPEFGQASYCASVVAGRLGVTCLADSRLLPIGAGSLAGVTEVEADRIATDYMQRLRLYRAGLLNGYQLANPDGEDLDTFERRIDAAIVDLERSNSGLTIVVGHRSSLTAALVHYARQFHGYPSDYYGYVALHTGQLSTLTLGDRGAILGVNEPPAVAVARIQTLLDL